MAELWHTLGPVWKHWGTQVQRRAPEEQSERKYINKRKEKHSTNAISFLINQIKSRLNFKVFVFLAKHININEFML